MSRWTRNAALAAALLPACLAAAQQPASRPDRIPVVIDWTSRYTVASNASPMGAKLNAVRDPRQFYHLLQRQRRHEMLSGARSASGLAPAPEQRRPDRSSRKAKANTALKIDWAVSLGAGTTPKGMFPAKYQFDANAPISAANCSTDFVVYPINSAAAGQANIIAFDKLYSTQGSVGGLCQSNGPAVRWAYKLAPGGTGRAVTTSPVLSWPAGDEVAFTDSANNFYVLKPQPGEGTSAKAPVLMNEANGRIVSASARPAAGQAYRINLSAIAGGATLTNTNSSIYVDYFTNEAYVGSDAGYVYKIKNVFCAPGALNCAAPSLDTAWSVTATTTTGAIIESGPGWVRLGTGKLTAPVLDGDQNTTGVKLFIGSADGNLYEINVATRAIRHYNLRGSADRGAITDPPIVEWGRYAYVFNQCSNGLANTNPHTAIIAQLNIALATPSIAYAAIGTDTNSNARCPTGTIHAGNFNLRYFDSSVGGTPYMYVCGYDISKNPGGEQARMYRFDMSGGTLPATPVATYDITASTIRHAECSPLTEFYNPNLSASKDRLFYGAGLVNSFGAIWMLDAATGGAVTGYASPVTLPPATAGTSGIIVDNTGGGTTLPTSEAASIYFATLGAWTTATPPAGAAGACGANNYCAVKLRQADLQ